jgi:hypothetical protein
MSPLPVHNSPLDHTQRYYSLARCVPFVRLVRAHLVRLTLQAFLPPRAD